MNDQQLSGSVKIAILTNALGPTASKPILDQLTQEERLTVTKLQSKLGAVPKDLAERIAQEFIEKTGVPVPSLLAAEPEERKEDKKAEKKDQPKSRLDALENIETNQLIQLIKDEHPQTIAIILVHLDPTVASDILGRLPDEVKSDVAIRIANLDKILLGMVNEINQVFDDILKNKDHASAQEAGGAGQLAEILNQIDGTTVEQIIEEIEEREPELAEKVKQLMFVFEDVVLVDDKGLQKVLRSVESRELAVALKASTEDVKQKIFSNMSQRAVQILQEEMEVSGAVRMKDVTDAQQKITRIIQDMERKGELIISGRGGEEFVG